MLDSSKNAQELTSRLSTFAAATIEGKESMVHGLIRDMPRMVDGSATLELAARMADEHGRFQLKLTEAASTVFESPIRVNGELIDDWAEDYIVVALDGRGRILGHDRQKAPEEFLHYAVSKAVCSILLDSNPPGGDLTVTQNRNYLKSLGMEVGKDVYLGGINPFNLDGAKVFLAGGSVHLSKFLRKKLVDGVLPESKIERNTLAGAGEMTFAASTATLLQHDMRTATVDYFPAPLLDSITHSLLMESQSTLEFYS